MGALERTTVDPIAVSVVLTPIHCFLCDVVFGMSRDFKAERIKDHRDFCCPNGHQQHFIGKSEAERLQEELASTNNRLSCVTSQRDFLKRQSAALRGVVTRTTNRIKNGVCPCCKRHFVDLERHVKGQHPGYGKDRP